MYFFGGIMLALFIAPAIAILLICMAFFISWLRRLLNFMGHQGADERRLRRSRAWHSPVEIVTARGSLPKRSPTPESIAKSL
jgi:hypothetical protein